MSDLHPRQANGIGGGGQHNEVAFAKVRDVDQRAPCRREWRPRRGHRFPGYTLRVLDRGTRRRYDQVTVQTEPQLPATPLMVS